MAGDFLTDGLGVVLRATACGFWGARFGAGAETGLDTGRVAAAVLASARALVRSSAFFSSFFGAAFTESGKKPTSEAIKKAGMVFEIFMALVFGICRSAPFVSRETRQLAPFRVVRPTDLIIRSRTESAARARWPQMLCH